MSTAEGRTLCLFKSELNNLMRPAVPLEIFVVNLEFGDSIEAAGARDQTF